MYVTLDRFTEAVGRLSDMYRERLLRIEMSPQGPVGLDINQQAPDVPEPGEGLYADIQETLVALLSDATVEEFVAARSTPRPPQFPEPEVEEVSRAKFEAVAAAFPIADLKQRAHLRQTSGVHVLTAVSWEALIKEQDSFPSTAAGPSAPTPRALVRITSERATESPFVPDREVSTFVVELDDLEYMLAELERLKVAFTEMGGTDDGTE